MASKSNTRTSWGKNRKQAARQWARVKEHQDAIARLAIEAWQKAGMRGGSAAMLKHSEGKDVLVATISRRQRTDPNNVPKLVCDALEGICYINDKDVESRSKNSRDQKGEPGVQIRVWWRSRIP